MTRNLAATYLAADAAVATALSELGPFGHSRSKVKFTLCLSIYCFASCFRKCRLETTVMTTPPVCKMAAHLFLMNLHVHSADDDNVFDFSINGPIAHVL